MVVMKMFPRFSASKVLASAALMLFAFTGAFAQGKVFNKDYSKVCSKDYNRVCNKDYSRVCNKGNRLEN